MWLLGTWLTGWRGTRYTATGLQSVPREGTSPVDHLAVLTKREQPRCLQTLVFLVRTFTWSPKTGINLLCSMSKRAESDLEWVPQTGTKENKDAPEARKIIRRHCMLGKNRGRRQNSKQLTSNRPPVARNENGEVIRNLVPTVVHRRVGSDLSLLQLADNIDYALLNDTLQFCSALDENLYLLEPCFHFGPKNDISACLSTFASDALYLNVMVYSTQMYLEKARRRTTVYADQSRCRSILQCYGKALSLLKGRVENPETRSSDKTIMAIYPMAMQALLVGDAKSARNHVVGLSRLVDMKNGGLSAFDAKQKIELLR